MEPSGLGGKVVGEVTVMLGSQGPREGTQQAEDAAVCSYMQHIHLCSVPFLLHQLFLSPWSGSHGQWVEGSLSALSLDE